MPANIYPRAGFALLFACAAAQSARAEVVDVSTFSCKQLSDAMNSDKKDDQYGASAILYWIAGYETTEAQGTVVDFDNLLAAFGKIKAHCDENPGVGVLSASTKFLGDNAEEPTNKAVDLAIIKCEQATHTTADGVDGLGQILMWLTGYHTDDDDSALIDFSRFADDGKKIGEYCAKNPQVGLATASEQFMGKDEAE